MEGLSKRKRERTHGHEQQCGDMGRGGGERGIAGINGDEGKNKMLESS